MKSVLVSICVAGILLSGDRLVATEPNDDQPKILKVVASEAVARKYSFDKAVNFLDRTSKAWTARHKCFTCHTNFAHLVAVADFENKPRYFAEVKKSLDELVTKRWQEKGPRWDAEVVMAAATLALVDRSESGKLAPQTRLALDRTWKVQRQDGGFDWLKCDWPPMESDDEYGAAMAAIAVSAAPAEYRKTEQAQQGIKKLRQYLKTKGLKRLHHQAMLIWAESLGGEWLSDEQTESIVRKIIALQKDDGGWNTAELGKWDREDGKPADTKSSDGYGTGFAIFVLSKAGKSADFPSVARGLQWLKKNQRESGRWYTRSLSRDNKHYLTHAGTAMAIMALSAFKE